MQAVSKNEAGRSISTRRHSGPHDLLLRNSILYADSTGRARLLQSKFNRKPYAFNIRSKAAMEMRSLTRCLRSRPTTTLLSNRPNQFLSAVQTKPLSSTSSQQENKGRNPRLQRKPGAGIEDVLNTLDLKSRRPPAHSQQNSQGSRTQQADASSGDSDASSSQSPAADVANFQVSERPKPTDLAPRWTRRRVDLKLGPALGSQVQVSVDRGRDLEGSINKLSSILTANNVKHQMTNQKYHVRRGQQEKLNRMKRWRRLFKYSFSHTVNKIQRMRRQGW